MILPSQSVKMRHSLTCRLDREYHRDEVWLTPENEMQWLVLLVGVMLEKAGGREPGMEIRV